MIALVPFKTDTLEIDEQTKKFVAEIRRHALKGHSIFDLDETSDSMPDVYKHQYEKIGNRISIRKMNDKWGRGIAIWTILSIDITDETSKILNYSIRFNFVGTTIYILSILTSIYSLLNLNSLEMYFLLFLSILTFLLMIFNFNIASRENEDFLKKIKKTDANNGYS